MSNLELITRLVTQGVAEIFPGGAPTLIERLRTTDRPLRIKLGIDPTRPDLHLGHTVPLRKLRQFQDAGHTAILLIGDFTAQVGDPTGKSETRPRLTPEEVRVNAETYLEQARLVLDFDTARLEVRYNSEWLGGLSLAQIIDLLASMSVAQMLAKEDFRERYSQQQPIRLHEFLYPLLQGYDSVALRADIELGGTDQKFNLLVGRDVQARLGQPPQLALLLPLMEGTDGVQKMSKSLDNYVGLTEDALTMYSKLEKVPDHLSARYFELLTDLPAHELPDSPRERQKLLALTITGQYHSRQAACQAQMDAESLVKRQGSATGVPEFSLSSLAFPLRLAQLLMESGLCASISEGRRQIQNGGVSLDGEKIMNVEETFADASLLDNRILKLGKKRFLRLIKA